MNTPPFRLAGISHQWAQGLGQMARSLPALQLNTPKALLIGGSATAALVVASAILIGSSAHDPTQTAAVPAPPAMPHTSVANSSVTGVNAAPATTPSAAGDAKTDREWSPAMPATHPDTPVAAIASTFRTTDQEPAAGPDERGVTPLAMTDAAIGDFSATSDPAPAAASAPADLRGSLDVQVAETDAEIAMLEASTGMVAASATPVSTSLLDGPLPDLRPAKAAKWGNLRDGPADESKVILVVPANAAIDAETDCNWCTVVYKGQRGYMYKNLIRRSAADEAKAGQGLF
ncbi:SH3 domain-containing protein [Aminobacter sp. AP02]|uniref:SH3 domain-containing protein n=1 Tax=Aminobacter sp. AP02 TaxID=2135737 RepID=UPI000D6AF483|nr:SH3 domain-containing protein [Aminobacter sp. AP02]PWK76367.1 SH3 domain-containing protein [Aminobacter sp. AP02]